MYDYDEYDDLYEEVFLKHHPNTIKLFIDFKTQQIASEEAANVKLVKDKNKKQITNRI